jgi:RimJ/RimL family protein N-acetyltransferase
MLEQEPEKLAKYGKTIVCAVIELLVAIRNFRKITIKLNIDDAEQINVLKNLGFVQEVRRRRHQYSERNYSTVIDFAFHSNGER